MSRNGYRVGRTSAYQGTSSLPGAEGASGAFDASRGVVFHPEISRGLAGLSEKSRRRGQLSPTAVAYAGVLVHELGHAMHPAGAHMVGDGRRYWDEAASEAAQADMMPAFLAQTFGHRSARPITKKPVYFGRYPKRVKELRIMSTLGSGAPHWRDRSARLWRRDFANATFEDRTKMIAKARAAVAR